MSKYTLEQLLGSRVRVKVLRFLFRNEFAVFTLDELAEKVQESRSAVREEFERLTKLKLIKVKR